MEVKAVHVGSTITNGSSAMRVTERVEKDPRWKVPGWRGMCISLEQFGGNTGMSDFVPDYLLASWRHVPFEWTPITAGDLEERYAWTPDYKRLQREVRPVPLKVGDHVKIREWNEGVGIVRRVVPNGRVWVDTECNTYRNYPQDVFVRTDEPLSPAVQP